MRANQEINLCMFRTYIDPYEGLMKHWVNMGQWAPMFQNLET